MTYLCHKFGYNPVALSYMRNINWQKWNKSNYLAHTVQKSGRIFFDILSIDVNIIYRDVILLQRRFVYFCCQQKQLSTDLFYNIFIR